MIEHLVAALRWLGWRTLFVLAVLEVALTFVVAQLASVVHGFDMGLVLPLTLASLLVGWGLARTSLKAWQAFVASSALGIFVVWLRVSAWAALLMALLDAANDWLARWLSVLQDGVPDPAPLLAALGAWWSATLVLVVRVRDWLWALFSAQPTLDPVASAIVWSVVVWLLGAWAAWAVRRRERPLEAFVPAAVVLCLTSLAASEYPFALLALLGATWPLVGTLGQHAREAHWQASQIDFPDDLRLDLALTVVPLTFALVMLAAIIPAFSVRDVYRLAQRVLQGPVASSVPSPFGGWFGAEPPSIPPSPFEPLRAGGLPRQHLLGSGPELSRQVVMFVKTDDAPRADAPRYYWRNLAYERYVGQGWYADPVETLAYEAGDIITTERLPQHRLVQQDVQVVGNADGFVYAAGTLLSADRELRVARRAEDDVFGALVESRTYHAQSAVAVVGEEALRATGGNYPDAVRNRYLALPDDVPARVRALARDLTATEPTPYDRARAIERYLRAIPYTLDLPAPPASRDVVDYFLFDLQKGYCDYDATAMVVLARAAGLPARLVMGYASGTYDTASARYVVTAADAHSWVEIYFVGYGWIEFEPTGGRPPLTRPSEAPTTPGVEVKATPRATLAWRDILSQGVWLALALLSVLALARIVWLVADEWRLRHGTAAASVRAVYARLTRHAARLAVPMRRGDTPLEVAASLAARVQSLVQHTRWRNVLAPVAHEAQWLTDLYVRALFSRHAPDVAEGAQAVVTWRRLRWRLWLARLLLNR